MLDQTEAREKWLAVLRDPISKKHDGGLANNDGEKHERCCLGHACYALNVDLYDDTELFRYPVMPSTLAKTLGITPEGEFKKYICVNAGVGMGDLHIENLVQLNDETDLTPAGIADVIEREFKRDNFKPFEGD